MLTKLSISIFLISVLIFVCISQTKDFLTSAVLYKKNEPIFNNTIICEDKIINWRDYQDGSLTEISAFIEISRFNFIYLYADWDAKSLRYKDLITQLACEFSDKINFHAINCFYGDCKKHFNLFKYPQLIMHIKDVGSYAYKGPFEYNYLANYFNLIQKPLKRIDNIEELFQYIVRNERVVIGNFDFGSKLESESFKTFYQASINSIHLDYENLLIYGVVLNKTLLHQLKNFGPKNNHKILIFSSYGFQNSLKNLNGINAESLVNWINLNTNKTVQWYYPDKIQSKSEKNKLLIFVDREKVDQNQLEYEKVYSVIKYFLLKNYLICTNSYKTNEFVIKLVRFIEMNYISQVCHYDELIGNQLENDKKFNRINEFLDNTELFLLDLKLYHYYASNLLGKKLDFQLSPISILIDHKKQSIFQMKKKFNHKNLDEFIKNQTYWQNPRVSKTKHFKKFNEFNNIIEINGRELEEILNSEHGLRNKDILLFYFNNWCGFCKLVNFNLMNIVHKYFKRTSSFIILKIDADLNDLNWNLRVSHLPTILFIPASNLSWKDSVLFDYNTEYSNEKLIEFILFNAKNPDTLSNFLINNFSKKSDTSLSNLSVDSRLRFDLINLVSNKLKKLEIEYKQIISKLSFNNISNPYNDQFEYFINKRLQSNKLQTELLQNLIV